MHISNKKIYLFIIFVLVTGAALWSVYSAGDNDERTPSTSDAAIERIQWSADAIVDQNDDVILARDDIPTSMDVDEEITFGVGGDIIGAQLSPDNAWVALSVTGAAHGGGWLYDIAAERVHPAAFQYGGSVTPLEWSPNGQFAVFRLETPAATTHLVVIDRDNTDDFVSDIGQQVHVEAEEGMGPPFAYTFRGWQGEQTLCFTFEEGEEHCRNATSVGENE